MVRRDKPLGVVFVEAHPSSLLFEVTAVVFGHTYMRFKKIGECVEGCRHWIHDDMGGFVEEESSFLVVCEVVRQAKHRRVCVATHCSQVIY